MDKYTYVDSNGIHFVTERVAVKLMRSNPDVIEYIRAGREYTDKMALEDFIATHNARKVK
jgi:hypothetical protein